MAVARTSAGMVRRRRRATLLTLAALVGALGLGGCASSGSESCISWAPFDDEHTRSEAADVVIDAVVHDRVAEREMFGIRATVWSVEVTAALKGEVGAGDRLEVASTPVTCADETYPDGDPLDTDGLVRLFLTDSDFGIDATDSGLALITPFDGVRPADD